MAALGRSGEAHRPEPQRDACLEARLTVALGIPGRVASEDATPEIFGRSAADPQVSARREPFLFLPLPMELRLPDAVERRASRLRLVEPPRRASMLPEPQPTEPKEHLQGERHWGEQRPAARQFQRRAQPQQALEPQQGSQTRAKASEPTRARQVSAAQQQGLPRALACSSQLSLQLRRQLRRRQDPGSACGQVQRARRQSSLSASSFR